MLAFLRDLAARAKPFAERDFAELAAFARDELGLAELAPWDLAYASEKLKATRYAFSEQEVRQYFPEDRVLAGLFRVVETIYGVDDPRGAGAPPGTRRALLRHRRRATARWSGSSTSTCYAREGKQGGAWMDDAINRRRAGAHACSIRSPTSPATSRRRSAASPRTFTHDEVITLFHEFGHGLHQLLTRVDVAGVSGIQGVEWDAVELPSQFMENFCWEWDVLAPMTAHVDTGEPLPRALFDRMLAAKNFQSGMQMVRQLEFALFDMLLHSDVRPRRQRRLAIAAGAGRRGARARSPSCRAPAYDRFMHSFGHIFAGGYAAGYYSYKWAEVLSADAYSLFEEAACCRRRSARASATRCSRAAAAARRWSRSSPSAAGRRNSTRFCGIMEWSSHRLTRQPGGTA